MNKSYKNILMVCCMVLVPVILGACATVPAAIVSSLGLVTAVEEVVREARKSEMVTARDCRDFHISLGTQCSQADASDEEDGIKKSNR